jgi:hypothetical protein
MGRRYTRSAEPYRDPPPPTAQQSGAQNPLRLHCEQVGDQSTEFSWGPGPVAPHLNSRPPSEGGKYMPRAPRIDPPTSNNPYAVGPPRQHRRAPDEAKGYAGDQVAP